ncbi:hypothetical protein CF319_g3692 [Tilletia indica]|nr:hypothetical protein CF319_g3692 [Tilletia indica]
MPLSSTSAATLHGHQRSIGSRRLPSAPALLSSSASSFFHSSTSQHSTAISPGEPTQPEPARPVCALDADQYFGRLRCAQLWIEPPGDMDRPEQDWGMQWEFIAHVRVLGMCLRVQGAIAHHGGSRFRTTSNVRAGTTASSSSSPRSFSSFAHFGTANTFPAFLRARHLNTNTHQRSRARIFLSMLSSTASVIVFIHTVIAKISSTPSLPFISIYGSSSRVSLVIPPSRRTSVAPASFCRSHVVRLTPQLMDLVLA